MCACSLAAGLSLTYSEDHSLHAGFLLYVVTAIAVTLVFMLHIAPAHGTTSIYVYITICSLVGSLSVMSCKVCTCPKQ